MDDRLEAYLHELARRLLEFFPSRLRALWVSGSVALEDYQPGRSDVDVFGALTDDGAGTTGTTGPESDRRRFVDAVGHRALPCPARKLELVLYPESEVRSGTAQPRVAVEFEDGAATDARLRLATDERSAADGTFWYGLDLSITRRHGVTLLGATPGAIVTEAPRPALLDLLVQALDWHLRSPVPLADDAVLNACRALVFARDDAWLGKTRAAARMPGEPVVQAALAARTGTGPPPPPEEIRAFVSAVRQQVVSVLETAT